MKKIFISIIIIVILVVLAIVYMGSTPKASELPITPVEDNSTGTQILLTPENTRVMFEIDEVLRGEPKRVVGSTNQVAGVVTLENNQLLISQIKVNARTLTTDTSSRDTAINRLILKTDASENEFITFTPTNVVVSNLDLSITGDLYVSGVTKQVTFTGSYTLSSSNEFKATASTVVNYKDFNLLVPDFPFLADVSEQVTLTIQVGSSQ